MNDTNYENVRAKAPRQVFLRAAPRDLLSTAVYAKVQGDPRNIFGSIKKLVHEMEPRAPIIAMKTVERQRDESLGTERMIATLSTGFSILATALSVLGLYGVQPADPASIAFAVLVLSFIAVMAGYVPARRAAASDPLRVLRYE